MTVLPPPLSPRARDLLLTLFGEASNLNLPVGVAAEVLEIRTWLSAQKKDAP